jgi:hypothetical protein
LTAIFITILFTIGGHKFEPKQRHSCPTLRQWALETIYAARDDYLHGNPVADDRLKLPGRNFKNRR